MYRVTARLLLLVLLAGTFAPLAAAASIQTAQEHCVRKPLAARPDSIPGCHHAAAAAKRDTVNIRPISRDVFRSNQCCSGHECCRSQVRARWAQVTLQAVFLEACRADDRVPPLHSQVCDLELTADHSVRAPPAL
jgi:hypothetical protein